MTEEHTLRVRRRRQPRFKFDRDGWAYEAPPTGEELWLMFLSIAAKVGRFGPLGGFLDIT